MKALILAAGRGSRMSAITDDKPKCLTEIAGKTILEWEILSLRNAGIDKVYAIGGYKYQMLEDYLPVRFLNDRWANTNSVMTLMSADKLLSNETCIISYSDIVYHPDIISSLMEVTQPISITYDIDWFELWNNRFEKPLLDAETLKIKNGIVKEIGNRTESIDEIEGQYMGVLKITPAGWESIKNYVNNLSEVKQDNLDMTALLSQLINLGQDVFAIPIKGKWCEVDQESDLNIYESMLCKHDKWAHDWRW